jgi:hypothetical protein
VVCFNSPRRDRPDAQSPRVPTRPPLSRRPGGQRPTLLLDRLARLKEQCARRLLRPVGMPSARASRSGSAAGWRGDFWIGPTASRKPASTGARFSRTAGKPDAPSRDPHSRIHARMGEMWPVSAPAAMALRGIRIASSALASATRRTSPYSATDPASANTPDTAPLAPPRDGRHRAPSRCAGHQAAQHAASGTHRWRGPSQLGRPSGAGHHGDQFALHAAVTSDAPPCARRGVRSTGLPPAVGSAPESIGGSWVSTVCVGL